MNGPVHLAWRYLLFHKYKTAVLVLSITLIFYLPVGLRVMVRQAERQLTARAEATPLLIGAKGSPLELVLNSLYARAETPETIPFSEVKRVAGSELAQAIPLYVRFRSQQDPIVGTTLDYFPFRGLRVARGRQMGRLGECVLGAGVARRRGLGPGDSVVSSPENVFDLAGVYPLKMRVAGVLAPSASPDDDAIFVDLKTAWIIEGLAHGHEDLSGEQAAGVVLSREGNKVTANAAVTEFNEITDENIASFHFHGDPDTFPITAIVAVPGNRRSATLLTGRYQASDEQRQIVRPVAVISELLSTVVTVENVVMAALVVVGLATLATAMLVFMLSLRLRRREIETMVKIGGSRGRIAAVLAAEVVVVVGTGVALAAGMAWATGALAPELVERMMVQ
ncbi:MAG: ABC transporter permease [bacterium]|nr:ABC transporter permease [bacterium]